MKTLNLALIFCLFIFGIYGTTISWNGTNVGDWSVASNWANNAIPGSGDIAVLANGITVSVSQAVTVDQLQTASNTKITVTGSNTFIVSNNITQQGVFTIQTEAGSTFNSPGYFIFSGDKLNCFNFGTINLVPFVNAVVASGTLSNSASGNVVNFSGNRPNLINQNFFVPSGFAFSNAAQTFAAIGAGATVTFESSTSISSNGWTFTNDGDVLSPVGVVFQSGAIINGNIAVSNTDLARPRPAFSFIGSFTLTNNFNLNVFPTFGAGIVAFNGAFTATFNLNNNNNVDFLSTNIQGNTILLFQNQRTDSSPIVASFGSAISIDSPGFNLTGNWQFTGSDVTFTTPRNLNYNLSISNNLIFAKPSSFASNALLSNLGGGSVKFTDGFSSANQYTFNGFNPTFDCTVSNNKQFAVSGSALNFIAGLTVNACFVTSTTTFTITGSVATTNGNTTLPANAVINGTSGFSFTGPIVNSITLLSTITVPVNSGYTATGVEVIFPSSQALALSENATLATGTGFFSLNGGITLSTGNIIAARTAFPSGASSINGNARVDWSGQILLRNTVLGGTADVWFTSSILAVKGASNITSPTFRFKAGVTLAYLWDQALPNSGCQLFINTNGNTGSRTIEGSVTAGASSNIVFDDNININTTATVAGTNPSPIGTVTFRTSGQTQASLTTIASVTLGENIYFNHTNFHLTGLGSFTLASARIYLSGGLNFPNAANDAIVSTTGNLYVGVVVNSTIGSTVTINGGLTTDDLDNIPTTASTKLTLFSELTQSRTVNGPYVLGSSLTFGGNVVVADPTTIDTVGTIEILGTSLVLQATTIWNNKIVISQPFTITSIGTRSLTIGEQTPAHGFNIPAAFTVTSPATVVFNQLYSLSFQTASTFSGNGIVTIQNTIITGTGAVTISPQTLTLNNVTLVGSGSYNFAPADQNLIISNFVRAFVPAVYNGNTLQVSGDTTISPLFTFSTTPLTINGNTLTVSPGSYTVNGRWIISNSGIVFLGATTLATTGSFAGLGPLTFNNSLILTQNTAISNSVTFGTNKDAIVTVSNGGFVLTLNGTSVTVNAIVASAGGSIVSTSPNPPTSYQVISGTGSINSDWTWSNSVQFGGLNVTGARTLNFNLALSGSTTYFTDGVTFNGGTFIPISVSSSGTLEVEKSITTNVETTLGPQIEVIIGGSNSFNFLGTNVLTLNGTFTSNTPIVFNQNVIFGYNNVPTSSNALTLAAGSSSWSPASASIQIWRTTVTVSASNVNIQPSLIFGASNIAFSVATGSNLTLNGNLNIFGTSFSKTGSGLIFLGAVTITSQQNNTLSGFSLLGSLTLNSTTTPWVEPVLNIGQITQAITLNGPVRLASPTFGPQAQINGPARVAITDSITVNSAFTFNSPVQLYVSSPQGSFTFNLNTAQSYLTFTTTPSLFNPLGYNINTNTNFILTSSNSFNILKFSLSTPLVIGDLFVNSGTLQLTSSSTTARFVTVSTGATLWIDGNAFTSSSVAFSQSNDGTSFSYYQLTVSSNNPPAITTGSVIYKGAASIVVNNFNWDGSAVTGITATSSNGASNNFLSVTGTPGYTYTSTRNSNNVQFTRTSSPTASPSPTQSNGPSPAVSASVSISLNMILFFAIFVIYFIF